MQDVVKLSTLLEEYLKSNFAKSRYDFSEQLIYVRAKNDREGEIYMNDVLVSCYRIENYLCFIYDFCEEE